MKKIGRLLKKVLTPVSILVIPHGNPKPLNLKIPAVGIFLGLLLLALGAVRVFGVVMDGLKYPLLVSQVEYYSQQFAQWKSTAMALHEVEGDFRRIFSLNSKDKVLETVDTSYAGSVDLRQLMEELQKAAERVDEIKDYLRVQKDIYLATPKGYPVEGGISSPYGKRENPISGNAGFHSGIDISASPGTPILATAEGIVSHSGWTPHSGYVVVLEHGCGFSTIYAHNKKNAVKRGEKVKRGDVVGYVGSTGKSTGPHVHYEIWEKGRSVNPKKYVQGRS